MKRTKKLRGWRFERTVNANSLKGDLNIRLFLNGKRERNKVTGASLWIEDGKGVVGKQRSQNVDLLDGNS